MKFISVIILSVLIVLSTSANAQQMFGKEKYGYNLPHYEHESTNDIRGAGMVIMAIADDDNFPLSSYEQGSIFSKIFSNLNKETNIKLIILSQKENFTGAVQRLERGEKLSGSIDYTGNTINGIFGAPFKSHLYSRNKDIYPAFFVNNIHILTSIQKDLKLKEKKDLSKYKGVYAKQDRIADNVLNDFNNLGIKEVESFSDAYEQLLTGKVDFIAASYYPSLLKAYELGIRNQLVYSKNSIWKMPLFIRVRPEVMNNKKVEELSRYLKSSQYKERVKEAFDELVEIYQKNTEGVVPPTYINDEPISTNEITNQIEESE